MTATRTPVTVETCFDCPAFCSWWDEIEAMENGCWDHGYMIELLVEWYNEGQEAGPTSIQAREAYDLGQAEYWDSIPSWA